MFSSMFSPYLMVDLLCANLIRQNFHDRTRPRPKDYKWPCHVWKLSEEIVDADALLLMIIILRKRMRELVKYKVSIWVESDGINSTFLTWKRITHTHTNRKINFVWILHLLGHSRYKNQTKSCLLHLNKKQPWRLIEIQIEAYRHFHSRNLFVCAAGKLIHGSSEHVHSESSDFSIDSYISWRITK